MEGYKKADIPKIVVLNSGLEEGYELLMDQNTRAVIIDDWSIFECIKKHYNYAKLEKQKDQNHGKLILSEINLPVFIRDDIEGITHFYKMLFLQLEKAGVSCRKRRVLIDPYMIKGGIYRRFLKYIPPC